MNIESIPFLLLLKMHIWCLISNIYSSKYSEERQEPKKRISNHIADDSFISDQRKNCRCFTSSDGNPILCREEEKDLGCHSNFLENFPFCRYYCPNIKKYRQFVFSSRASVFIYIKDQKCIAHKNLKLLK